MKLYLECGMGASGNMVMAALYELLDDKELFHTKMEQLDLPGVEIVCSESVKCGITGTHVSVKISGVEEISDDEHEHHDDHTHEHHNHEHHNHDHTHDRHDHEHNHHNHEHNHDHYSETDHHHHHGDRRYSYNEILTLIQSLDLSDIIKENSTGVYKIIGQAEAKVHGTSIDEIHFHEVGSIDAVVDVVGCSILIDMLGVSEVTTSPIHVGFGKVRCEHGVLPVPAPATTEILKGIPIYSGRIEGELCTPTGAALLKQFTTTFGSMPIMKINKIGYGMGTKDFPAANCIRAFLYENTDQTDDSAENTEQNRIQNTLPGDKNQDTVYEISCNLDDMTPEAIGAAFEVLLESNTLDVFTTPIMMKKSRPATMLSCLCYKEHINTTTELMIKHTSTLGVRIKEHKRFIMNRTTETIHTAYGDIKTKKAEALRITKVKPEYDDIRSASIKHDIPVRTIYDDVMKTIKNQ